MGRKKNDMSNDTNTYNNRVNLAFGDLGTDAGISALNEFMSDKSYVGGFLPSQADIILFEALRAPPLHSHPHALRWFLHIQSFGADKKNFPISVQVRWLFCGNSAV
jgi:elongation factor 1-beta